MRLLFLLEAKSEVEEARGFPTSVGPVIAGSNDRGPTDMLTVTAQNRLSGPLQGGMAH